MKKVKFRRYTLKQGPRVLPQWIADQLDEFEKNPPSEPYPPTRREIIIKAIEESGLDRKELSKRMRKLYGEKQITPDYIDKALANDKLERWLSMRFIDALYTNQDDFYRIERASEERKGKILDNKRRTIQALKKYRCYGPHVHALFKPYEWLCHHKLRDHLLLIKLAMVDDEEAFDPPSAEEVGYTISKSAKSFMCKTARELFEIGGYRYYRMPNEIYDFDLEGNLLAAGPINMDTPPGLMPLLDRSCRRGESRIKPVAMAT